MGSIRFPSRCWGQAAWFGDGPSEWELHRQAGVPMAPVTAQAWAGEGMLLADTPGTVPVPAGRASVQKAHRAGTSSVEILMHEEPGDPLDTAVLWGLTGGCGGRGRSSRAAAAPGSGRRRPGRRRTGRARPGASSASGTGPPSRRWALGAGSAGRPSDRRASPRGPLQREQGCEGGGRTPGRGEPEDTLSEQASRMLDYFTTGGPGARKWGGGH